MNSSDILKTTIEAVYPTNTVLYDHKGLPSFMVRIPKFRICDVVDSGSESVHPAFIVNGREVPEILISKYQNVVRNGCAYSLPGEDPCVYVSFDEAKAFCENKGKGWHLMSNAEWAALSLWCRKNGFMPRGNTQYGRHHDCPHEHGRVSYSYGDQPLDGRVATGSGPVSWAHNGHTDGIYDLIGNVWEGISGLRLVDGQIQIIVNNDSAAGIDESASSDHWRAVTAAGELIEAGARDGLCFDIDTCGDGEETEHALERGIVINTQRVSAQYTGQNTSGYYAHSFCPYGNVAARMTTVPELLNILGIVPAKNCSGDGTLYLRNYGERIPLRGGRWTLGANAGMFSLNFGNIRDFRTDHFGFRAAFVEL